MSVGNGPHALVSASKCRDTLRLVLTSFNPLQSQFSRNYQVTLFAVRVWERETFDEQFCARAPAQSSLQPFLPSSASLARERDRSQPSDYFEVSRREHTS